MLYKLKEVQILNNMYFDHCSTATSDRYKILSLFLDILLK